MRLSGESSSTISRLWIGTSHHRRPKSAPPASTSSNFISTDNSIHVPLAQIVQAPPATSAGPISTISDCAILSTKGVVQDSIPSPQTPPVSVIRAPPPATFTNPGNWAPKVKYFSYKSLKRLAPTTTSESGVCWFDEHEHFSTLLM